LLDIDNGNHIAVANFTKLGNGDFILADEGGGYKTLSQFLIDKGLRFKDKDIEDPDVDNPVYTGVGEGDEFTISFKLDGTTANGSYKAVNKPADDAIGPFYFGAGISGQDDALTIKVKSVVMKGYVEDDDFEGTPAYFKNALDPDSTQEYAGFVGYGNTSGSAGEDVAKREAE